MGRETDTKLRIGVDLDNTIVCYDRLIHQMALNKQLVPASVRPMKNAVRDHLRREGREDAWTELQGELYGPKMIEAAPFDGAEALFATCRRRGADVFVISHRSKYPYLGPKFDLHAAAYNWLEQQGFFNKAEMGLSMDRVYLEPTEKEKLQTIAQLGCDYFVDDLPEFLLHKEFPKGTERILFDPMRQHPNPRMIRRVSCWDDITGLIFEQQNR